MKGCGLLALIGVVCCSTSVFIVGFALSYWAKASVVDVVSVELSLLSLLVTCYIAWIGFQLQTAQDEGAQVTQLLEMWASQCDDAVITLNQVLWGSGNPAEADSLLRTAFSLCSSHTGEPINADIHHSKCVLNSFASDLQLLFPKGLPRFLRTTTVFSLLSRRAIHWILVMEPFNYVWAVAQGREDRALRAHIIDELAGRQWFEGGICPAVMHSGPRHATIQELAAKINLGYKSTGYDIGPGRKLLAELCPA